MVTRQETGEMGEKGAKIKKYKLTVNNIVPYRDWEGQCEEYSQKYYKNYV